MSILFVDVPRLLSVTLRAARCISYLTLTSRISGTHGLMKCVFDQPLTVQDAVLMNLYKRAFPQWTYNARVERTQSTNNEGMLSSAISEIALDKANDTEMHE